MKSSKPFKVSFIDPGIYEKKRIVKMFNDIKDALNFYNGLPVILEPKFEKSESDRVKIQQ